MHNVQHRDKGVSERSELTPYNNNKYYWYILGMCVVCMCMHMTLHNHIIIYCGINIRDSELKSKKGKRELVAIAKTI